MSTVIRTLGTLIALALAGTASVAETAPTGRSNATAPISAELAKTCRALAINAPYAACREQHRLRTGSAGLFQRVRCQARQYPELESRRALTETGGRGRVTRSHVGFVP
jgi:hypothetical protein